jgi:carboxylesterase type B
VLTVILVGLSVGMHIMAYGGEKPVPFQKAIGQSQILEPGIVGEFTNAAMAKVLNSTSVDSQATIDCLRMLSAEKLVQLQTDTAGDSANIGDEWLPVVDGDFLPAAPSQLLREGRFAAIPTIIGYTEDDTSPFVEIDIDTDNDTTTFFREYAPAMTEANLDHLLSLYPVEDFAPSANLSAEHSRSARILRDILMVCEPLLYGRALTEKGQRVYYYVQNQTVVDAALDSLGLPGLGVVHTSEFAYMFNNISHYDSKYMYSMSSSKTPPANETTVYDYPYHPTPSDEQLAIRATRSWSTFASIGRPSWDGHGTLEGWKSAFAVENQTRVFVIGSDEEGLHSLGGNSAIGSEKIEERCAFINSPEIIEQLQF